MNDPVSDTVRGVLDGHIILERAMANKGHFPAIDVPASISRLMPTIISEENYKISSYLKELTSVYKENEEIVHLGAYSYGSNPLLDKAIQVKNDVDKFLKQDIEEHTQKNDTWNELKKIYTNAQYSNQTLKKAG